MSNQTESGFDVDVAPQQGSQQDTDGAPQGAAITTYQAPHYQYGSDSVPGIYLVMFYPGHTIAKHFRFLGRDFELTALDLGYFAHMDDQLLNDVRRDPGVKLVEDDVVGTRDQQNIGETPQDATTTTYQAPFYKHKHNVPGSYLVKLRGRHSILKHYQFLGRKFELAILNGMGYFANMDDELLDAIRRDPGVEFVEDNVYGSRD